MIAVIGGPAMKGGEKKFGSNATDDDEASEGESEDGGSDKLMSMGRMKFAKNLVVALGLDPADVDVAAVDKALAKHYEACAGEEE